MSAVSKYLDQAKDEQLNALLELLRIPSVSTDPERSGHVKQAAEWIAKRMRDIGVETVEIHETPGHPIVYGEWMGAGPKAPTILVYGHYDVQPEEPVELWDTPPFEPTVKNGRLYARGACDDKGQFIIHLHALEAHLKTNGTCPVNVKYLIEGEEEIGSPNLDPFLKANKAKLACDSVVISDTAMFAKGKPSLTHGLRGLAYLEVKVVGTKRDLHSGVYGGAVANPALVLAQMIAKLKDARGKIKVPGFYDDVRKLTRAERQAIADLPHSDAKYARSIGAPELFGEAGFSTLERTWARPSLDVNGIWGGYTGEGAKTVIPAEASAKISTRLVPDQKPKDIERKLKAYLKEIAPDSVKVTVTPHHGGNPWLAEIDHPALQAASRALKRGFGKEAMFTREGGSIPVVASFQKMLKVPSVMLGIGLNDDNLHAPNEKIDLDQYFRGIKTAAFLMEELAEG